MSNKEYTDDQLSEMKEDAFVSIKEACIRLQERTSCGSDVVLKMLNDIADFYTVQEDKNRK